ncbi:MAG: YitT family protein [Butyrivibrio sp.]|nr:YitT family protein [Butyrivibrio sp.]
MLAGTFLYSFGINCFVVPMGLYTGGLMGICQLIRTILVSVIGLSFGNIDIAGIIYYMLNIPLFLMARKKLGRLYLIKTIMCVTSVTVLLMLIPIPSAPIIDDTLASCVIAGIICGGGIGLTLMMGASDGGMDIVGVLLIQWKHNFSVGKANLGVNFLLYAICLFMFDIQTVIYSLIYATISAFSVDKVHAQNIDVAVTVITKNPNKEMESEIFNELGRGITKWDSVGAYTGEHSEVMYILVNKYEVTHLKRIIRRYDPQAFIVSDTGVNVAGNYNKHL